MKAWTIHQYGDPDVVKLEEIAEPQPGASDVTLRVEAAGVNPLDNKLVSGAMKDMFPVAFPYVLGMDIAGTVERIGSGVTRFKAGDRVAVYNVRGGGFAELAAVPEANLARIPDTVSFVDAAALPIAASTAWEALMEKAELRRGQTVLIHAGSGGVGHFAVQFAKLAGAHVIATTSTANVHLVSDLGADEVIDYTSDDFRKIATDVDVVLDPLGGETQVQSFDVMREGGVLVSLVQPPDEKLAARKRVRAMIMSAQPTAARLERIAGLVADGSVRVLVDDIFAFADVPKALARMATGHVKGKLVVRIR